MKVKIKILGYYVRAIDKSEFIHYSLNGKEHLTNGVFDWTFKVKEKISTLIKVERIDIGTMRKRLERSKPYARITEFMKDGEEDVHN